MFLNDKDIKTQVKKKTTKPNQNKTPIETSFHFVAFLTVPNQSLTTIQLDN